MRGLDLLRALALGLFAFGLLGAVGCEETTPNTTGTPDTVPSDVAPPKPPPSRVVIGMQAEPDTLNRSSRR